MGWWGVVLLVATPTLATVYCGSDAECTESALGAAFGGLNGLCCQVNSPQDTGTCSDPRQWKCCAPWGRCRHYELCCNGTCCNSHTETCVVGGLHTVEGYVDACTSVEYLSPERAVFVVGVPVVFGFGALIAFVLCILYICVLRPELSRDEKSHSMWIEKTNLVLALTIMVLALPLYVSPLWRYGVTVTVAAVVAVFAMHSHDFGPIFFLLGVQWLTVIYLVNPFAPNMFLTLGPTSGVLGAIRGFLRSARGEESGLDEECHDFFLGYYALDRGLRDARVENPVESTFGLCAREWLVFLAVDCLVLMLLCTLSATFSAFHVVNVRREEVFDRRRVYPTTEEMRMEPAHRPVDIEGERSREA